MTTVLFACVHNAGRSQMAAAFFNQLADPSKAIAISAGTIPADRVHPEVVRALAEVGLDVSASRPRALASVPLHFVSLLITMGCGETCPVVPGAERHDWPVADPANALPEEVRAIRDDLRERVRALVEERGWARGGPL